MNTQLDRVEKGEEQRAKEGGRARAGSRHSPLAHPERFPEIGDRKYLEVGRT